MKNNVQTRKNLPFLESPNSMIFRPSSGSRRVRRPGSGGFSPVSAPRRSLSRSLDGHGDPDIGNLIIWVRSRIPEKYLTCRRGDGFGPGGKPGGVDRQPMYEKRNIFSLLDAGHFKGCPPWQILQFFTLFKKPLTRPPSIWTPPFTYLQARPVQIWINSSWG